MDNKLWFRSKTVWLNLIVGLATTLSAVAPSFNAVTEFVSGNTAIISGVWMVLGIVVRFITKDKVVLSD